jgi:hypothetical protein
MRLADKEVGRKKQDLILLAKAEELYVTAAQKELNKKVSGITSDGRKEVLAIIKSSNEQWLADEKAVFTEELSNVLISYIKQEDALINSLNKKEITQKEYETKMANLHKEARMTQLDMEIAEDEKLLKNTQLTADEILRIETDKNNKLKEKIGLSAGGAKTRRERPKHITDSFADMFAGDQFKDDLDKAQKYRDDFYAASVALANEAADAIIAAQNREFDNQLKNLDTQKEAIQTNAKLKEDAINAGAGNEIAKANEVSKLHAQTAIQEQQIEEQKRQVAMDRARFEKEAGIASVIINTAVAIAKTYAEYGFTPAAIPLVIAQAAAGAVQLAAVASAPIPAYKEGTTGHSGGLFIAGDGGEPEYIQAPGKKGYWSASRSTLYDEGVGTKVTPLSKMMSMDASRMGAFGATDSTGAIKSMSDKITDKLDETIEAYIWAANKNKIVIPKDNSIANELRKQRHLQ